MPCTVRTASGVLKAPQRLAAPWGLGPWLRAVSLCCMGGLSSDPAKAQRQRDALAAGRRKMAENTLASQGKPKPAAKAPAKPRAKAAAKASKSTPRRAADPDRVTYREDKRRAPAPRTREQPRREDREPKRRGFLDGFLGRID